MFVRDDEGTGLAFTALLTSVFVIGVLNGLVEGSFVGLALQLSPRYSQVRPRDESEQVEHRKRLS